MVESRSEGFIRTEAGNIGNASVSLHLSSREFCSQMSVIKLPPGILPRRPSYHRITMVTIQ